MGTGRGAVGLCAAIAGIKKMLNTSKIYKMRIVFQLSTTLAGNVDVVELLRRMICTSGLVFAGAKQNRRQPRISYGPSVKRGQYAQREYVDIYLFKSVPVAEVKAKLEASKPQGFTLLDVQRIPYALAGVQQLASVAVYEVTGNFNAYAPKQTIENYVSSARIEVTRHAANGICLTTDIKPFVCNARTLATDKVELVLNRVEDKWLNPWEILQAWLGIKANPLPGEDPAEERFKIIRQGLYWVDSEHNLHLI